MTITRYDLGIQYLGGIAKPTSDDVGKFAVVRLDGLDRPNLSYETQVATVADDTFATTLAPFLRGSGLTVDANGNLSPRPRPRNLRMQDYFISGGTTSGAIGGLGWNLLGSGTPALTRSGGSASSTLKLNLATSASANDRSVLALGDTESRVVLQASDITLLQCAWSHNTNLTVKRVSFGLNDDFANNAAAAANALAIYYDSAVSPNYQIVARSASAGSPVVTSAVVPANTPELISIYQPTAGIYQFYVGNTLVGTISSGVPTANMNVGFRLETLAASAKNLRIGYFGLECSSIAGCFDDDTFLEA